MNKQYEKIVSEEKDRELTAEEVHSFLKDMVKSKSK